MEEDYKKVKNYIALNPECNKILASSYTGVSIDVIDKFIEEGKFEEYNGCLRIARRRGMNPQRKNELARKFVKEIQYDVEPVNKKGNKTDSMLVEDLQKRYGTRNNSESEKTL